MEIFFNIDIPNRQILRTFTTSKNKKYILTTGYTDETLVTRNLYRVLENDIVELVENKTYTKKWEDTIITWLNSGADEACTQIVHRHGKIKEFSINSTSVEACFKPQNSQMNKIHLWLNKTRKNADIKKMSAKVKRAFIMYRDLTKK